MIGILSGLRAQLWQVFSEFQFIFSFPISTIVKLLSSSFYHSVIYSSFLDFTGSIINLIRFLKDKSSKDSGTGFPIVESQCCFLLVSIWLSWLAILADHMIVFLLLSFTLFFVYSPDSFCKNDKATLFFFKYGFGHQERFRG